MQFVQPFRVFIVARESQPKSVFEYFIPTSKQGMNKDSRVLFCLFMEEEFFWVTKNVILSIYVSSQ